MWRGGAIRRYIPDGVLDAVITVPVDQVTSCNVGGADLNVLFITTSRYQVPPETVGERGQCSWPPPANRLPTAEFLLSPITQNG